MCAQKQFLDAPEQANPHNRTKMGPNNRIEAIREVERDILDALKRLSKYTTDTSMKKLHAMPLEDFTKKHAALRVTAIQTPIPPHTPRYTGRTTTCTETDKT
jgi:hypothetical protein